MHRLVIYLFFVLFVTLSVAGAGLSQRQIYSFATLLTPGAVAQSGDPRYTQTISIYNGAATANPLFVVYPANHQDIQFTILFSTLFDIPFSVKGGGHSAAGYSLNNGGVVIDLISMNSTSVSEDGSTLTVGGGALWSSVYKYISANFDNKVAVGGDCATVGVGGYTQGGGFSILSRRYGLAVDNLLSVSVVTGLGLFITVSEDSPTQAERDLFWAIRGGGGGNWGVITEFKFRLHQSTVPKYAVGQFCFPLALSTPAYTLFASFVVNAPDELTMYSQMVKIGPSFLYCISAFYNGNYTSGIPYLSQLASLPFAAVRTITNATFIEYTTAVQANEEAFDTAGLKAYIKSGFVRTDVTPNDLVKIYNNSKASILSSTSDQTIFFLYHLGGQISRGPASATAFAHRNAPFSWEIRNTWHTDDQKAGAVTLVNNLASSIAPYTNGSYVNQIDPNLPNWETAYYGSHYNKLRQVKQLWDPFNFFNFAQSVRPFFSL